MQVLMKDVMIIALINDQDILVIILKEVCRYVQPIAGTGYELLRNHVMMMKILWQAVKMTVQALWKVLDVIQLELKVFVLQFVMICLKYLESNVTMVLPLINAYQIVQVQK